MVKRKTSDRRLSRGLHALAEWCRSHRHEPLDEQHQTLSQKLRGHCAYYGITGNSQSLGRFRSAAHLALAALAVASRTWPSDDMGSIRPLPEA